MSLSFDISTAFDSLDDSLVSDVINLDSWCSSFTPPVPGDEPVRHPTPRPQQKCYSRTCGHPRPTPAVTLPPVTHAVAAAPVLSTPVVASSSTQPCVSGKPDKGKGRQTTTPPPSPSGALDPSVRDTPSSELTPEQCVCFVRMLKRLDEWFASGWQPGVDRLRLRSLAEIFNSTEAVASGGITDLCLADLAWRLADSEGWEKSARSSIMGTIDIQSFLGRKEAELGNRGRPSDVAGPPLSPMKSHRNSEPVVPKRVRFQGLDNPDGGACSVRPEGNAGGGLLVEAPDACVPPYDEACRTLAQHLAFVGGASYGTW